MLSGGTCRTQKMVTKLELIVMLTIALGLLEGAAAATTYKVGDDIGWRIPPNSSYYDSWVGDKKFEAGDTLEFVWTGPHNVREVTSKAEYDSCVKTNGVLHESSPVNVSLKDGTHYFICIIGSHCQSGQKVTVVVGTGNSSSSPPSATPKNGAALSPVLSTSTFYLHFAASLVNLWYFLLY